MQHDAHEFIISLLNSLLEEEQRQLHVAFGSEAPSAEKLALSVSLCGSLKSVVKCQQCNTDFNCVDQTQILSFGVAPPSKRAAALCTLDDCRRLYSAPEDLQDKEYACPVCRTRVNATKTLLIDVAPQLLILTLKRFDFSSTRRAAAKIETYVDIPLENFEIPEYRESGNRPSIAIYDCVAICNHIGKSSNSGHYTAHVRRGAAWYKCDDDSVTSTIPLPANEIVTTHAYILFYVRRK